MDRLEEYETFLGVARSGGFSAAAAELGLSPSAVSKQVRSLEDRLGIRLLNRTTRRVALTDAGRAFRERIETIVGDIAEAEEAVAALEAKPRGVLRVGAPMDFGRAHLAGPIAAFTAAHPALSVEIELADRFVDLLAEGLDVVVRIGALGNSSLVARWLAPSRRVLCASPDYLDEHGRPASPEALASHRRIAYAYESERSWVFDRPDRPGDPIRIDLPVAHRANNGEVIRELLLAGRGVALLPTFVVGDELRAGRLEAMLSDRIESVVPIHAVYPHRKHLSAKVRAFVDHLVGHCGVAPYWEEGLDLPPLPMSR